MKVAVLFASALFIATGASANPASGIIEICRSPGVVFVKDKKAATVIPADSAFMQDIPQSHRIGSVIRLTQDTTLGTNSACVRANAIVTEPSPFAPPITSHTIFMQQLEGKEPLTTRVVEGFK